MKSLATIFGEAQQLRPVSEQHSWIVSRCSQELRRYSVPVYNVQELRQAGDAGSHILIGLAFYSLPELELIDAIVPKLQTGNPAEPLEIFDVMSCKTHADFESCIPGIGKVFRPQSLAFGRMAVSFKKSLDAMPQKS